MRLPETPPTIIIGMHRSGTSLVAKILSELGVHIGLELDGHNEAICFKNINKRLLYDCGAYWAKPDPFIARLADDTFLEENAHKALRLLEEWWDSYGDVKGDQLWGWKDPRNTITLPVWLKIFPNAKAIHVVRNGIDVALSLYRREIRRYLNSSIEKPMFPPTVGAGYKLWEKYLSLGLSLERFCANWMSLRYGDIISQPQVEIDALCRFLAIDVAPEVKLNIARRLIKQPTRRSTFESAYVWLLLRLRLINPAPLIALGYEV